DNLNAAAKDVSRLTNNLNQSVPEIRTGTLQALDRLNAALAQVQNAAGGLQNAVGANSPLQAQLAKTLADISDAANSFRLLAEYLNQNPNAIVTGKGAETPR
ncbi:MAG TPA: hypothetical protein VFO61_02355, partial [Alphaproteobacteria bacterium]|nr:hypothetical protein [Alphaproteobacteria bacterium]